MMCLRILTNIRISRSSAWLSCPRKGLPQIAVDEFECDCEDWAAKTHCVPIVEPSIESMLVVSLFLVQGSR